MNAAHWHLVLNHIPVLGAVFGLLILAYGWFVNNEEVLRVALALLFVAGATVLPVYETGHAAEEYVEGMTGVTESAIEHHEATAQTTYYLMILLGLCALGGLVESYRTGVVPVWWLAIVGIVGLVATTSVIRTADAGGYIRHPEIQMSQPGAAESTHDHSIGHEH